jgi:hypothetical protein
MGFERHVDALVLCQDESQLVFVKVRRDGAQFFGNGLQRRHFFPLFACLLSGQAGQQHLSPCPGGERVDVATSCAEVTSPALPVTEPRFR